MTKLYDVIIIGAGPSGTSCAYNIKRNHADAQVLLVDKAEFPRYKPCGGGISPEVANYFDFDLTPAIDYVCDEVVMVAGGKKISSNKYPLWMVRREKFDNFLLEQAQAKGVEFRSGVEVTGVVHEKAQSCVQTKQGEFSARVVVIAEGGRGKLAKQLGLAATNITLAAMEYEHYTANLDGKLYIDFDYNLTGYAWNFPKSDGLSLGIGGLLKGQDKGQAGLPASLRQYSQNFAVTEFDKTHLHGHPIMLYSGRQKLVHGNLLLIGEIAGCVDPLTAEGIRPAIKSGYLAAKVISAALAQNKLKLLNYYDTAFHREIGCDFYYARIISYFLNRNMATILPLLATTAAVEGFMSVFSGKNTYRDKAKLQLLMRFIWRSLTGKKKRNGDEG